MLGIKNQIIQGKKSESSNNFKNVRSIKATGDFSKSQERTNIRIAEVWRFTIRLQVFRNCSQQRKQDNTKSLSLKLSPEMAMPGDCIQPLNTNH